jgi:predicted alpha/beta superfamily hydrolase
VPGRAPAVRRLGALLLLAVPFGPSPLGAQEPGGAPGATGAASSTPADPVPAHDTWTVASRALGETRTVHVHVPAGYQASRSRRYPVLYMPDGGLDEDFPHVVRTVDSLVARGAIRPVLVVGVPNTERRRDLTGPTRVARDSAIAPRVGGSAAFRRFLAEELVPAVGARYRATGERALVGESLAGLFVVETFLTAPASFTHYVALDPSVWWNGGALVDSAGAWRPAGRAPGRPGTAPRTLYLASSRDDVDAGTERVAARLRATPRPGLTVIYTPRPDLTHATIYRAAGPAALARVLR